VKRWCRGAAAPAALLVCAAAATAAQRNTPPTFRSAIELTTVNATVFDRSGHLVRELPRELFEVYEDGELQTVSQFTNERVPVSLAMLVDVSDSMFGKRIADARDAVQTFVSDLLDPADEFAILAFNHRQHLLTEWTDDRAVAAQVLAPIHPSGSTAIYDAILAALPLVESRRRLRLRDRHRGDDPVPDQPSGRGQCAEGDYRSERRHHAGGAEQRRGDLGDVGDRRRAEQPVPDRLQLAEVERRQVPQHPRAGEGQRLSRAGPQRIRRWQRLTGTREECRASGGR
jgi:hypothetical protein